MVKPVLPTLLLLCLPLAVHCYEFTFSTPQQCGSLQISWTGSPAGQLNFPLSLYVLPFASTVVKSPISNNVWNNSMTSGSSSVPFSLPGGTQFLAAVVDGDGVGVGPVSQIITAASSPDTSCLLAQASSSSHFIVRTTLDPSACPSLIIFWDDTVRGERPTIQGFSPGMLPIDFDLSEATERVAESVGNFTSKSQVVVLFDDKASPGQTSDLLTVGGTDAACRTSPRIASTSVNKPAPSNTARNQTMMVGQVAGGKLTNHAGVVIGIVSAAVVGVAIIIFGIFSYRHRRDRHIHGLIPHSRSSFSEIPHNFNVHVRSSVPRSPVHPRSPTSPGRPPMSARNFTRLPPHSEGVVSPSHSSAPPQLPPAKSPSLRNSKRRSFVSRTSSDVSSAMHVNASDASADSRWNGNHNPRPDSATLPDTMFLRQFTEPAPPVTPRSGGLTQYNTVMGYAGADELRSPHSTGWTKKVH